MKGCQQPRLAVALLVGGRGGVDLTQIEPAFLERACEQAGAAAVHAEDRNHPLTDGAVDVRIEMLPPLVHGHIAHW